MKAISLIHLPEPRAYVTTPEHNVGGAGEPCQAIWSHGQSDILVLGVDGASTSRVKPTDEYGHIVDDFLKWADEDNLDGCDPATCAGHTRNCRIPKHNPTVSLGEAIVRALGDKS